MGTPWLSARSIVMFSSINKQKSREVGVGVGWGWGVCVSETRRMYAGKWDPFYWYGLTLIPIWISKYTHYKVWNEITRMESFNINRNWGIYVDWLTPKPCVSSIYCCADWFNFAKNIGIACTTWNRRMTWYIPGVLCMKQVLSSGTSNYTPTVTVGCNYLSLPLIST